MGTKVIVEGNAVYEIDEACMKKMQEEDKNKDKMNRKENQDKGEKKGGKRNQYK